MNPWDPATHFVHHTSAFGFGQWLQITNISNHTISGKFILRTLMYSRSLTELVLLHIYLHFISLIFINFTRHSLWMLYCYRNNISQIILLDFYVFILTMSLASLNGPASQCVIFIQRVKYQLIAHFGIWTLDKPSAVALTTELTCWQTSNLYLAHSISFNFICVYLITADD